ncbi:Uncharacterised protein [Mycobacteroides abscessus subsp. abscessus]|nr:Uncharacterised protein [Mycobacteroides abscessus subsp. abscessus]
MWPAASPIATVSVGPKNASRGNITLSNCNCCGGGR